MTSKLFEKPDVVILSCARSGTHFLSTSLASHPKVHTRGECVLRYKREGSNKTLSKLYRENYRFTNKANCVNTAIIMYPEVHLFEELCGSLFTFKIIHLLRNAEEVAKSIVQKEANISKYGEDYKSHYKIDEECPSNVSYDLARVAALKHAVKAMQIQFLDLLKPHQNILILRYEALTKNKQVNMLPKMLARTILDFLNLDYCPLTNTLRKTR